VRAPTQRLGLGTPMNSFISQTRARFLAWRNIGIFTLVICAELAIGISSLGSATYRSPAHVFSELMNGPLRLLFPVIVALVVGTDLSAELSDRYVAFTRSRQSIRDHLWAGFWRSTFRAVLGFGVAVFTIAIVAFVFVPSIWPQLIDPTGYGTKLDSGSATAFDYDTAPLTQLTKFGWLPFAFASAIWLSFQVFVFSLITFCSVVLITKPIFALSVPFLVYIFQSAIFQVLGLPGQSFLISTLYPTGLGHFDIVGAAAGTLVPGVCALLIAAGILYRAKVNPRFS
jgi:hypothetical protein